MLGRLAGGLRSYGELPESLRGRGDLTEGLGSFLTDDSRSGDPADGLGCLAAYGFVVINDHPGCFNLSIGHHDPGLRYQWFPLPAQRLLRMVRGLHR